MQGSDKPHRETSRPFLIRVFHTPLTDLIRLRVTARFDVWGLLTASRLPESIQKTIFEVVQRTCLWRSEKVDVAHELITHFADGTATGQTSQRLLEQFGKPKRAARRIRREKIRARPLRWRAFRRVVQATACTLTLAFVVYVGLWARFFLGRPNVSWDYVAEINAQARAIPEDQRAWPLYREALLKLEPIPEGITIPDKRRHRKDPEDADGAEGVEKPERRRPIKPHEFLYTDPSDEHWDAMVAYLRQIKGSLDLTRQAAARPRLGFVYRDPADAVECPVDFDDWGCTTVAPPVREEIPKVVELHMQHLRHMQMLCRLLRADALRAAEADEGDTATADLLAILDSADHCRDTAPFMVADLIQMSLMKLALDTLGEILKDRPGTVSDEYLETLANRIASVADGGPIRVRSEGDRAVRLDMWQRVYTDNGKGDGYLTYQGALELPHVMDRIDYVPGQDNERSALESLLGFSLLPVVAASRQEMSSFCDQMLDDVERDGRPPLWEQKESTTHAELDELSKSATWMARYWVALTVFPMTTPIVVAGEHAMQRRDAALVVIALEQYRRRNGDWPERLEQLTPQFLSVVPPDRFDGKPLKYSFIDGSPVLYSIGVDRHDDGGVPPKDRPWGASIWEPPSRAAEIRAEGQHSGDWVLWPSPERSF